jgi:hypothetical protein
MTTTVDQMGSGRHSATHASRRTALASGRTRSVSLGAVGAVSLVVSAWGGIVPYIGPVFGYGGTGVDSWHWDLSQAVLALIPGAIGCLFALSLMGRTAAGATARRVGLTGGGLLAIASGAWFVIGPLAWPVLINGGHYFVTSSPLRELEYQVGYALGPGLILATCGAFAIGWSTRHNQPLGTLAATGTPAESKTGRRSVPAVETEPVQASSAGITIGDLSEP